MMYRIVNILEIFVVMETSDNINATPSYTVVA